MFALSYGYGGPIPIGTQIDRCKPVLIWEGGGGTFWMDKDHEKKFGENISFPYISAMLSNFTYLGPKRLLTSRAFRNAAPVV